MKRAITFSGGIIFAVLFLVCQIALGEIVTVNFTGMIGKVELGGDFALDGSVVLGTDMAGYFVYDTDAIDMDFHSYKGEYSIISFSFDIGNYSFSHNYALSPLPTFSIYKGDDSYQIQTSVAEFSRHIFVDGVPQTYDDINWGGAAMSIILIPTDKAVILNDKLPDAQTFLPLSVFMGNEFVIDFRSKFSYNTITSFFTIRGEITSLAATPEPATVMLLVLGGLMARKCKANWK